MHSNQHIFCVYLNLKIFNQTRKISNIFSPNSIFKQFPSLQTIWPVGPLKVNKTFQWHTEGHVFDQMTEAVPLVCLPNVGKFGLVLFTFLTWTFAASSFASGLTDVCSVSKQVLYYINLFGYLEKLWHKLKFSNHHSNRFQWRSILIHCTVESSPPNALLSLSMTVDSV